MSDHSPETRLLPGSGYPPTPAPAAPSQGNEISFRQVFGVLRRRYRLVLLIGAVGAMVGALLASQEPETYQATAVLRVAGERRALTGGVEAPTPEVAPLTDPILSLVQLVQSRSVLGAVIDSVGLQLRSVTPEFFTSALSQVSVNPRAESDSIVVEFGPDQVTARYGTRQVSAAYGQPLPLGPARFAVNRPPNVSTAVLAVSPREIAIDWLGGGLSVTNRLGTDLIDVAFVSTDPTLAQRIVNSTVENFRQFNIEMATSKSRRRRIVLEAQLKQTDSAYTRAQAELAGFQSRLQIGSSQGKLAAEQTNLLALEESRIRRETERDTYRELLNRLRAGDDRSRNEGLRILTTSPTLGDSPQMRELSQRLTTYQLRVDSMTTGRSAAAPNNPDLLALRDLIRQTQGKLIEVANSQLSSIDMEIAGFDRIRRRGSQSIEALPALTMEEARLSSRVDVLGRVSEQLRQDAQRARLAEEVEAGDVEIINLAAVPYKSLWTIASIKFGIGLVLGLMLGGALAFMLEAMNTSIRRPEDIESMLHIPGLAVIPRLEAGPTGNRSRKRSLKGSKAQALPRAATAVGTEPPPFSIGTEAFRMLRTSLVWADGGERLRTLVVTSAAPGEGKTLTSANLAVSFANEGLRVLLVDCDVRRPRMHGLFRVSRSPGLLDVLAPPHGGTTGAGGTNGSVRSLSLDLAHGSEEALAHVLRPTPVRGLTLLTCGALPTNASSLLSGVRMRTLLTELNDRFDLVILDTPPVLATADAGILGGLADGVLLVVRAGQTDRTAAQRAHQQLMHVGARVVGAVLNDPKGELAQFGDYYYPYEYAVEKE